MAIAATSITSSMFLTGLAPNLLAIEMVKKTAMIDFTWVDRFVAIAPVAIALLLLLLLPPPLAARFVDRPEVKGGDEVPAWANAELGRMGGLTSREIELAALVLLALGLRIFGGSVNNSTTVAIAVIVLVVIGRVVSRDDMLANMQAWKTLVWFATLVAPADGLNRVGFVKQFATRLALT